MAIGYQVNGVVLTKKDALRLRKVVREAERSRSGKRGTATITRLPTALPAKAYKHGWAKLVADLKHGQKAMAQPAIGIKGTGIVGDLHEYEFDTAPAAQIEVIDTKLLPAGKKFASGAIVEWTEEFGKRVVDFSTTCYVNG